REAAADELLAWLTRAQAMALYQRDEAASLRDAVSPLTTGAMWVKAEVANAAGRHAECGARFAALIDRAPEHPQLDDAMINAARCWSASVDRARAREHARALLRRAPGSEHAREARTLAR
ncbi:MAG: hypothetical protein KC468_35875, partial [Myxococcales bacterium]|nr:hypothetical protein [Myxococcales bacterium]